MLISEIAVKLTTHYREHKAANGGHKTSADGKYGYKSLRYKVAEPDGTEHGPFLGRGSALTAFRTEIKGKGKEQAGVNFLVETIKISKTKDVPVEVLATETYTVTLPAEGAKRVRLTEDQKVVRALERTSFNKGAAAKLLGISRDTLNRKIKKFSIALPGAKAPEAAPVEVTA